MWLSRPRPMLHQPGSHSQYQPQFHSCRRGRTSVPPEAASEMLMRRSRPTSVANAGITDGFTAMSWTSLSATATLPLAKSVGFLFYLGIQASRSASRSPAWAVPGSAGLRIGLLDAKQPAHDEDRVKDWNGLFQPVADEAAADYVNGSSGHGYFHVTTNCVITSRARAILYRRHSLNVVGCHAMTNRRV